MKDVRGLLQGQDLHEVWTEIDRAGCGRQKKSDVRACGIEAAANRAQSGTQRLHRLENKTKIWGEGHVSAWAVALAPDFPQFHHSSFTGAIFDRCEFPPLIP